jgi:rare lipoprotein A (peptidoglycan hydrolase)
MPPGQQNARLACVPMLPFLAFAVCLATGHARAAGLDLSLSADALTVDQDGGQGGASHVLVAMDNSTLMLADAPLPAQAAVADAATSPGFDPADVDPAVVRPGDILQTGVASWYGSRWSGRRTASGSRFNPEAMTAASPTLPLGTRVLVTLEGTARSVLVTITDRQAAAARVIDLSRAAARRIGLLGVGTARVVLRRG